MQIRLRGSGSRIDQEVDAFNVGQRIEASHVSERIIFIRRNLWTKIRFPEVNPIEAAAAAVATVAVTMLTAKKLMA